MKLHYLILALILLLSSANAQTNQQEIQYNINKESDPAPWKYNRVGLYGSFMSGYGLAYQHIFKNRFAIKTQIFGYAVLDEEEPQNDRAVFVWGADLQYGVFHTDDYRFYAMAGVYYNYLEEEIDSYGYLEYEIKKEYTRDLNFGIGLGAEVMLHERLSVSFELGYYLRKGFNTKYIDTEYKDSFPLRLGIGVGGGIYIMF